VHASAGPAAAAAKGPALSIGVSGGRQTVRPGVMLTYTVKIRNIGTVDAPRLHVDQTLPPGLQFISATGNGARGAGAVRWLVSLRPGHAETFRTVARVGKTPPELLRLATVACASTSSSGRPIVCATDSDQLPAGVAAAARASHAGSGSSPGHGYLQLVILILAFSIVVAVGGWRLAVRRHARHAH
jgi:uncharacterized repeat protein (TIGR01451 family)